VDDRTPTDYAESRSKARYPSMVVPRNEPVQVLSLARERDADLVGIEEAQFFDDSLIHVVETLRRSGRHVIASGLNLDFAGRPFGSMPELLARADEVTMLSAICVVCGETATRTQRLVGGRPAAVDDPLIVIGGFDTPAVETYEARCLRHHEVAPPRSARGVVADEG
jgi:thymidine kinase